MDDLITNTLGFDKSRWELVKRTCAAGATNDEFEQFMYLCGAYGLDPFLKEIFFSKGSAGKPATFMIARDGYLKIANKSHYFNGMESDTVYEGDKITKDSRGRYVVEYGEAHTIFDISKLTGAYCNVFRKDREFCSSVLVSYEDSKKNNSVWQTYPNIMITKVAEEHALKRAFAISGLVGKEQVDYVEEDIIPTIVPVVTITEEIKVPVKSIITTEQHQMLQYVLKDSPELAKSIMKAKSITMLAQYPKDTFMKDIEKIRDLVSKGEK